MVKQLQMLIGRELPFLCTIPAFFWQLIFVIAPVAIIIYFSLTTAESLFTISHYASFLDVSYLKIISRSLFVACTTAICCLLMAYPVAYYLAMYTKRHKEFLLFLLILPFWVNILVQIYAWFFLLERNGLINSILLATGLISQPLVLANSMFAVYLVMIYCYLPFMIMPLYSALEKIDKRLLEASADLGASYWQTLWRVTVPLSLPGIKTGLLLVLIPAFGEYVVPVLLGGSKYLLVGSAISYYFLVARDTNSGATFTCVSALTLISLLLVVYGTAKLIRGLRRYD